MTAICPPTFNGFAGRDPAPRDGGRSRAHELGVEVYSTGQVARIFRVSAKTVCDWIDSGLLKGFRMPGRGRDRRVLREELARFLAASGLPASWLPRSGCHVLAVGLGAPDLDRLKVLLPEPSGWSWHATTDPNAALFEAGMLAAEHRPDVVVIDLATVGARMGSHMAERLRLARPGARLAAVTYDGMGDVSLAFDAVFLQPVRLADLVTFMEGVWTPAHS